MVWWKIYDAKLYSTLAGIRFLDPWKLRLRNHSPQWVKVLCASSSSNNRDQQELVIQKNLKRYGFLGVFASFILCGCVVVWMELNFLSNKFRLVNNVVELERLNLNKEYIYVENKDKEEKKREGLRAFLSKKIKGKDKLTGKLAVWVQSRSDDPWTLLQLAQSSNRNTRLLGVRSLANKHHWDDYQYRNISQACKGDTLVALARSPAVDQRFFLPPPKLSPPRYTIEDEFRVLLSSLPKDGVDKCVQYFTSTALREGNVSEERGGLWCFGGTGLEFAKSLSSVPEERVTIFCLNALASHCTVDQNCSKMVEYGGIKLLQRVNTEQSSSIVVKRSIARILGNLAVHSSIQSKIISSGWVSLLADWINSTDLSLRLNAARALANLDHDDSPSVFEDGIFLLHPLFRQKEPVYADIVFIHGLLGGPFKTWRQQDRNLADPDNLVNNKPRVVLTRCWPKDWLARDCPNIRILTVEYDTDLSDWNAKCPFESEKRTLPVRSAELLEKLRKAGVGTRPVIWVGHSMGGLLIKQMLQLAESETKYLPLRSNTCGVVFYSVPHKGSTLAAYSNQARYLLFPSVEVKELSKDSSFLKDLHRSFQEFAEENTVSCLSFGELNKMSLGMKMKALVVPVESSDPGIGEFHAMNTNHLNICKPWDRESDLYTLTLTFIRSCLKKTVVDSLLRAGSSFKDLK